MEAKKSLLDGNRKLVAAGVAYSVTMALGTIMAFSGTLLGPDWVELAKWVTIGVSGGFAVGNGMEHIGKKA